jgi:hypothetical protein
MIYKTSREKAIKLNQKKSFLNEKHIIVDGEFIAVIKRKPSKLQKLENDLKRLQDNYDTCVRNGDPMAEDFKAAIEKTNKQIAKIMAA